VGRSWVGSLMLLIAVALPGSAQTRLASARKRVEVEPVSPAPSADSLIGITRRGSALAEYDRVANLASDALLASYVADTGVRQFIARRTVNGWEVAAGELSADHSSFLIAQLSTPGIQRNQWAATSFDPPRPDSGYYARAARAIATSLPMFRPAAPRAYMATTVPAADGQWWVYLYPAPKGDGVWPRGGDMRFRVSADGRVITDARRLHEAITEYSAQTARSSSAPVMDKQLLVTADTPEDTDVFHVLQRRPAMPELMSAGRFLYRIDVDGRILLLGSR